MHVIKIYESIEASICWHTEPKISKRMSHCLSSKDSRYAAAETREKPISAILGRERYLYMFGKQMGRISNNYH